jgi:hypothetical protein
MDFDVLTSDEADQVNSIDDCLGEMLYSSRLTPIPFAETEPEHPIPEPAPADFGSYIARDLQVQRAWTDVYYEYAQRRPDAPRLAAQINRFKVKINHHLLESGFVQQLEKFFEPWNDDLLYITTQIGGDLRISRNILQYLSGLGCDFEYQNEHGHTSLIAAVVRDGGGLTQYISMLIEFGSNIHATDDEGRIAVLLALQWFHLQYGSVMLTGENLWRKLGQQLEEKLVVLLRAGCDANARDSRGITPTEYVKDKAAILEIWMRAVIKARVDVYDLQATWYQHLLTVQRQSFGSWKYFWKRTMDTSELYEHASH